MSWTMSFQMSKDEVLATSLEGVEIDTYSPEDEEQANRARSAVSALVASGILGDGIISGSVSGHASPDSTGIHTLHLGISGGAVQPPQPEPEPEVGEGVEA